MPLQIIKKDITTMKCDAIVNPSNNLLLPFGGIDEQIHKKAGLELMRACLSLGGVETGEAKITPAFNLPCRFVIHTSGPVWLGGNNNERELLKKCYQNCLKVAVENGCKSVAFPLISSGSYNYPKDKVLKVALKTISAFLQDAELEVYLVVYDKASYEFSKSLFGSVSRYIEKQYYKNNCMTMSLKSFDLVDQYKDFDCCYEKRFTIEAMLDEIDDSFAVTLLKLIDLKGMTDLECYKRANISKQTWYKIQNEKDYKPSKNTVLAFAISLKLTFEETQHLLSTVGFTLSRSSKFDIIIEYFIKKGVYDIMKINETLFEFDQPCLGV